MTPEIPASLAGSAAGAAASVVIGTAGALFMGAYVDALLLGVFVSFVMVIGMVAVDSKRKAFSLVVLSSLIAGYGSPALAAWLVNNYLNMVNPEDVRLLCASVIAITVPVVLPLSLKRLAAKVEGA